MSRTAFWSFSFTSWSAAMPIFLAVSDSAAAGLSAARSWRKGALAAVTAARDAAVRSFLRVMGKSSTELKQQGVILRDCEELRGTGGSPVIKAAIAAKHGRAVLAT